MNTKLLFLLLLLSCTNPLHENNKSIIVCLNSPAFPIQENQYPPDKLPEYYSINLSKFGWSTFELQFALKDTLKSISVSPSENDTLYFDTIWIDDQYHQSKVITFENVVNNANNCFDTSTQLGFGYTSYSEALGGQTVNWIKTDIKTIAFCPSNPSAAKTFDADINFVKPILSNGHIKIRVK